MRLTLEAKPGVIWDVCPEIDAAQDTLAKCFREAGAKAVVTSARDSEHSQHTAHAKGQAIDLRITGLFRNVPLNAGVKPWYERVLAFAHDLSIALEDHLGRDTGRFDVVLEKDHIHVEYSKGEAPNILNWSPQVLVYTTKEVKGYLA